MLMVHLYCNWTNAYLVDKSTYKNVEMSYSNLLHTRTVGCYTACYEDARFS